MILNIPKYFTRQDLKISGVYFVIKNKKIIYIGQTTNLYDRLIQEANWKRGYDYIRIIQCDVDRLIHYEKRWIIKFRPKYNTIHLFKWIHDPKKGKYSRKMIPHNVNSLVLQQ